MRPRSARAVLAFGICLIGLAGVRPRPAAAVVPAQVPGGEPGRPVQVPDPLDREIGIDLRDVPLVVAIEEIARRSGVTLAYRPNLLPDRTVTLRQERIRARDAFMAVLAGTDLAIVVAPTGHVSLVERPPDQGRVEGTVVDENGRAVPDVAVRLVGTGREMRTDPAGRFRFQGLPLGRYRLAAFDPGYGEASLGISVTGPDSGSVTLALVPRAIELERYVAVGYGRERRRDLTGAVSTVNIQEAITTAPIATVQEALQGRVAGMQVTHFSSEPGGGLRVRVRGAGSISASNEPLYVIDGLPVDAGSGAQPRTNRNFTPRSSLVALGPNDVESIEILKDAAATAIYGARGANGVILITTRKGRGQRLQLDYSGYTGIQQVVKTLDVLDAGEYMRVMNELAAARGDQPQYTAEQVASGGRGTDWQDVIFAAAPIQSHQISLGRGTGDAQYYASLGYFQQDGLIRLSGVERITGRFNALQESGRWSFGTNVNVASLRDALARNSLGENGGAGVVTAALQMPPIYEVRDAFGRFTAPGIDLDNPAALLSGVHDEARTTRMFGSLFAEYAVSPAVTARLNFGGDRATVRQDTYESRETIAGAAASGIATVASVERATRLAELTVTYDRDVRANHWNVLAGATYQVHSDRSFGTGARGFDLDVLGTDNLDLGRERLPPSSSRAQNQIVSFLSRTNYQHAGKYLATATIRADGSSRFGENRRFGYFPSMGLAWRLSEEPFVPRVGWLDELKLRVSFGVTGNQEIGNYASRQLLGAGGTAVLDEAPVRGTSPTGVANPDLRWERTTQANAGVDLSILDGRVGATLEVFSKRTTDLLLSFPIPLSTGFSSLTRNAGAVRNRGMELTVNTLNLDGPVRWSTGLTLSTVRNRVTDLGGAPELISGAEGAQFLPDFTIIREGEPVHSYFGYRVDGVVQQGEVVAGRPGLTPRPGDLKIRDVNADGVITPADRVVLGTPFPAFVLGLSNRVSANRWSVDLFVEAVKGQKIFNALWGFSDYPTNSARNRFSEPLLGRWTPTNPTDRHPSFVDPTSWPGTMANSRAVQDGSYLRLQHVTVAYDLPQGWLGSTHRNARVYASAENVLTLTSYGGYNPDVSMRGSSSALVDLSAYPAARTLSVGVSLGW